MEPKRLVIIDGYSLLYRAFFATRFLSTSGGRPTNALFGFTSMLFYLLDHVKPDAVVVALDAPGKTFRHAEYSEYKGTRRDMPDELRQQMTVARDLITALGIPSFEVTGYEADDVVGTLSRLAESNGYHTTIVTGDLDSLQLVDPCVSVMTNRQGVTDVVVYTPQAVIDRYGFEPRFIPDYKAFVGDSSDNIPGVPGIGEKTASKLIQQFGSVEDILARLDEVEGKHRKKIEPGREQLIKSRWLATIDCNAPVHYDFAPFQLTAEQVDKARSMMEWLEFKGHIKRMPGTFARYLETADGSESQEEVRVEVESIEPRVGPDIRSAQELRTWIAGRPYALVLQQTSAQASMFEEAEQQAFVAVGLEARKANASDAFALLESESKNAILHDAKPLYKRTNPTLPPPKFDSMLAGYVLQSGRSGYTLRDLVQGYLDVAPPETPQASAAGLFLLESAMRDRLEKEGQTSVLDEIEQPLIPILAEMESTGIQVSSDFLQEFSKSLEVTIEQTAGRIYEMAGVQFLIASPKQLGEVLFDKLCIPGAKKTKTGYATGAEVLQEMALGYPICSEVLAWRELTKLKSTYADSLPKLIGADGRIHTTYNQTVAATGRLSSNEPNLQNIPIRTELGRKIRKAFVAAEGYELASFDYSQIELRLLAHLCGDEALVEAFQDRVDVHRVTAGLMFGLEPEAVSREQRNLAKMLNYAVLYGVTDFGLSSQLGVGFSVVEAKALISQYNERFPKIKEFTTSVVIEARSKGFTTTLSGRRRYFPDIHNANRNERMSAERQAMNAPIQGAAADMIKIAMIGVRKTLGGSTTRMLLQVHDELVFEMSPSEHHLVESIRREMSDALRLNVPIDVDAKIGPNWSEMHEL